MFCVFLESTPPKEYPTIDVTHNDMPYTFSKDLSLNNSELIHDRYGIQTNGPINVDFDHEYDEFQLISDLFNYKRVFITRNNIDFLEYAANHLKIPILINKTTKFRNHYHDFLKNPIFKEIQKLQRQIFSIINPSNSSSKNVDTDSEYDYSDNDDQENDISKKDCEICTKSSTADQELIKTDTESINESKIIQKDEEHSNLNELDINQTKSSNDDQHLNDQDDDNIPKLEYDEESVTTVAHILFSAFLANPFNLKKVVQIVKKDPLLFESFIKASRYCRNNMLFSGIIHNLFPEKERRRRRRLLHRETTLDTNIFQYIDQIIFFYNKFLRMEDSLNVYIETMKNDDVDVLQQLFISNETIKKDYNTFSMLFNLSAILSATKCFKYFLLNYSSHFRHFRFDETFVRSAIIGGNMEIFRLSLEKYQGEASDFIKDSILFHRTEIMRWLITNDIQFLSIYNCSCSRVLYGTSIMRQKWYLCRKCHPKDDLGVCKFCAKHCHLNKDGEDLHTVKYSYISSHCYCDDDCPLSKNVEIIGNKKFVEIDDLVLLSIYCLNLKALKILIDEGAYILRCRDRLTKDDYSLGDVKLNELISGMRGYKPKSIDEIENPSNRCRNYDLGLNHNSSEYYDFPNSIYLNDSSEYYDEEEEEEKEEKENDEVEEEKEDDEVEEED
ncbi:hypothetical protein M9Y10_010315 [Tritrichomonas musculus]|uniref:UBR-type domain-containing protein n=1 Tax=Tritrichomonas musculus TaxID=1915356 RepID=A0ABR2IKE1_9EUKA